MADNTFLAKYQDLLKARARAIADQTIHGNCENFSEYKQQCGVVMGLNTALDILVETVKEFKED